MCDMCVSMCLCRLLLLSLTVDGICVAASVSVYMSASLSYPPSLWVIGECLYLIFLLWVGFIGVCVCVYVVLSE